LAKYQNPRIGLTLPPDLLDVVKNYSEVMGKAPATMILDLLVQMRPMMEMTVELSKKSEQERQSAFVEFQLNALNALGQTLTTITEGHSQND